jgi:hypothetical protein
MACRTMRTTRPLLRRVSHLPPPGGGGATEKQQFPEKPDTEAAFEMPIFPDKEDSFAPPEPMFPPKADSESRNVPGRASASNT